MRALRAVNAQLQKESQALKGQVQALEACRRQEAHAEAQQERATVVVRACVRACEGWR